MASLRELIKWTSVSRVFLFLFQIIVSVLPDHRHSMDDVFMSDKRSPHPQVVETLFGGFDNWDSEYYLHISYHWYQYEPCHAFFPLYPLITSFLSQLIYVTPLGFVLPYHSILLISGVLISNVSFIVAAGVLYILTIKVFSTSITSKVIKPSSINTPMTLPMVQQFACLTVLLFTINPANVFMASVYTESLFACFSFSGMLAISSSKPYLAATLFACASCTRSNGIVLSGFIVYYHLFHLVMRGHTISILSAVKKIIAMFLQVLIVFSPFVSFQLYSYYLLCSSQSIARPPLCEWSLPIPYSYVQKEYWDVGFLRYYKWKQIPNFLLAAPMILMCVLSVWRYFSKIVNNLLSGMNGANNTVNSQSNAIDYSLLPYVVQLTFLLVFGVLCMHVQVITRFISSSTPVIYWFAAMLALNVQYTFKDQNSVVYYIHVILQLLYCDGIIRWIVIYFLAFNLIGFVMHCNFLPWT